MRPPSQVAFGSLRTQHRGRSRSRSRPPTLISRDPRPWTSLFKAPVGSSDLSLDFYAPET
ncbi:unnamed protein product [Musa textilis]